MSISYRKDIDGLRALAIIPVVLYHAGAGLPGGFLGVDIFFVISGFLITLIIAKELDLGVFSITKFYQRRIRRIVPVLLAVIFFSSLMSYLYLSPKLFFDFAQSVIAVFLFVSNFLFMFETGYFDASAHFKPLIHTWSLGVEEQFYFFFPILMFCLYKFTQSKLTTLALLFALAVFSLSLNYVLDNEDFRFYSIFTRAWELFLGSISALLVFYYKNTIDSFKGSIFCKLLLVISVFGIVFCYFFYEKQYQHPGLFAGVAILCTCNLVVFGSEQNSIVSRFLSNSILVYVGLISYSLYLWHQPVLTFYSIRFADSPSIISTAAIILVIITLSITSYYLIERPFRDKKIVKDNVFYWVTGSLSAFLLTVATFILLNDGYSSRFSKMAIFSDVKYSPERDRCHTSGSDYLDGTTSCVLNDSEPEWAVFGDSHGVELSFALSQKLKAKSIGVAEFTFSGCFPSLNDGYKYGDCSHWTSDILAYIKSKDHLKNIVISYRINSALFGDHVGIYPNLPDKRSSKQRDEILKSYVSIANELKRSNKRVYIVIQAPELRSDIYTLIFDSGDSASDIYGVERWWWNQRSSFLLDALKYNGLISNVIDPADVFCNDKLCYAVKDNRALYFDDNHMSLFGASLIVDKLIIKHNFETGENL